MEISRNTDQYSNTRRRADTVSTPDGETIGRMEASPPESKDDILEMKTGTFTGYDRYFYLKDHTSTTLSTGLGSIRVTLKDNGSVAGYDDYYPFGLQLPGRSSNTANTHTDQNACPDASGFTGHFLESEGNLGLYHAQARLYDPEVPRFYGVDNRNELYPHFNSYQYGLNNPIKYTDPTGECISELPCPDIIENHKITFNLEVKTSVGAQASAEVLRFKGATINLGSYDVGALDVSGEVSNEALKFEKPETYSIYSGEEFRFSQSASISAFGLGIEGSHNLNINKKSTIINHDYSGTAGVGPAYFQTTTDLQNKESENVLGFNLSANVALIIGAHISIDFKIEER